METIQSTIGEISRQLADLVGRESYFELEPFGSQVYVSDQHDARLSVVDSKVIVEVAEPSCGTPNLDIVPLRDNSEIRNRINSIWQGTRNRKLVLSSVMTELFKLNSNSVKPNRLIRLADIATSCDMHITIVSRILDSKICWDGNQAIRCKDYIYGLKHD